ncbi:MAG TPA: hypothetical protein VIP06_02900 [Nocardioides sp.]
MRITANELRAAANAARTNAERAATVVLEHPRDDEAIAVETAGRSWIILPQPVLHQRGVRRWDIVAEGEGTVVAAGVLRAVAEHFGNWDPNVAYAIAAVLDDFADPYEASRPTPAGQLYHTRCGGMVHADPANPDACLCFAAVSQLVKAMLGGAQ